jgi:phasin family protein
MTTHPKKPADQTAIRRQTAGEAKPLGGPTTRAGLAAADQVAKRIADMRLLAMPDMDAVTTAHRRNMETLSAANRVALEAAQVVTRQNMQIMQQAMIDLGETLKALASAQTPETKAAKQIELLKVAYQRALFNMEQLSDLIRKASTEAAGLFDERFSEAMDEIKELIEKFGETGGR